MVVGMKALSGSLKSAWQRFALRPSRLTVEFILRCILLRAFWFTVCCSELDAALSHIATTHTNEAAWTFKHRIAFTAIVFPTIANLLGVLWPLLHLPSFELHYRRYNQLMALTLSSRPIIQLACKLPWIPGSPRQYLLLHGVLLVVHQDPVHQYLLAMGLMLATYEVLSFIPSVSASRDPNLLQELLESTRRKEHYVLVLLLGLLVYRVYNLGLVGCALQRQDRERQVKRLRLMRTTTSNASLGSLACMWHISRQVWFGPLDPDALPSTATVPSGVPIVLSKAYVYKLVAIKAIHGAHFIRFAWQRFIQQQNPLVSTATAWKLASAGISIQVALVLLGHVICAIAAAFGHPTFTERLQLVNRISWLMCGLARICLILLDTSLAKATQTVSMAGGQQLVYHSLLVLILSLFAHEEPLKVFWGQLMSATLLFCGLGEYVRLQHQHIQGAVLDSNSAVNPGSSQYGAIQMCTLAAVLGVLYRTLCVGQWRVATISDEDLSEVASSMNISLKDPPTRAATFGLRSPALTSFQIANSSSGGRNPDPMLSTAQMQLPQAASQRSSLMAANPLFGGSKDSSSKTLPKLHVPVESSMPGRLSKRNSAGVPAWRPDEAVTSSAMDPMPMMVLPFVHRPFDLLRTSELEEDAALSSFYDYGTMLSMETSNFTSKSLRLKSMRSKSFSVLGKGSLPQVCMQDIVSAARLPEGFTTKVMNTSEAQDLMASTSAEVVGRARGTTLGADISQAAAQPEVQQPLRTAKSLAAGIKAVGFNVVNKLSSVVAETAAAVLTPEPQQGNGGSDDVTPQASQDKRRNVLRVKSLACLIQAGESVSSNSAEPEHQSLRRAPSHRFMTNPLRLVSWMFEDEDAAPCTATDPALTKLQILKDQLLVTIELPLCTRFTLAPILSAFTTPAMPISSMIAKLLPAIVYWSATVGHAVAYFYSPQQTHEQRVTMWAWRLDITLVLLHVSKTLVGTDQHFSALRGLSLLAAKWGLLGLGSSLFLTTLPSKVLPFLFIHYWQQASFPSSVFIIMWDMCLYVMCPLLTFGLINGGRRMFGKLQARWKLSHAASAHADQIIAYLGIAGQAATALIITIQMLPSQVAWQSAVWGHVSQVLMTVTSDLLSAATPSFAETQAGAAPSSGLRSAGLIVGLLVLVNVSYAAIVKAHNSANPRQQWYQQQQLAVFEFRDQVMREPCTLAHIVDLLREATAELFAGEFLVKLGVLDQLNDAEGQSLVTMHVVHWGYKKLRKGLDVRTMPLNTLASMMYARQEQTILFCNDYSASNVSFEDWDMQCQAYGAKAFLVLPLSMAGQCLGILAVSGTKAGGLDEHMLKLITDYSVQLCHIMFTWRHMEEKAAGQRLLADLMPEQVARSLIRQAMKQPSHIRTSFDFPHHPEASDDNDTEHTELTAPRSSRRYSLDVRSSTPAAGPARNRLSIDAPRISRRRKSIFAGDVVAEEGAEVDTLMDTADMSELPDEACGEDDLKPAHHMVYKQWHPEVTILFADIVSYTALSQLCEPEEIMQLLHELYSLYDSLCADFGVYKVETIGDCYMAATGLLIETDKHASNMFSFAKGLVAAAKTVRNPLGGQVQVRVGIHSGRVMSGIVGSIRARYCLFGDTVNTASRMESTGVANVVQISGPTYELLTEAERQEFKCRGYVAIKGKGDMMTYTWPSLTTAADKPLDPVRSVAEPYSTLGLGF